MTPELDAHGAWAVVAVRGSIAAATIVWAAAEYLRWRVPSRFAAARALWSAGALLIVCHALAVFHFVHGWSHQEALSHTARQTALLTGLDWSWGLYVNYAFIALWAVDSAWSWWNPGAYQRQSTSARDALLAIFLFMFVNGGIVFAPWPARGIGIVAVASVIWSRWTRSDSFASAPPGAASRGQSSIESVSLSAPRRPPRY